MPKVVLFCGGRGSATIVEALLREPDVDLTLVVNAYDDGLSTGALRLLIPGMLGPSDFRKNISYLLDLSISSNEAVKNVLEYRLPADPTHVLDELVEFTYLGDLYWAPPLFRALPRKLLFAFHTMLTYFFQYADTQPAFDYSDCSLGNILFAGAYLETGSFNATVKKLSELLDLRAKIVNVSDGECCVLQALKEDGTFLPNEAAIVGAESDVPIVATYLVSKPVTQEELDAIPYKGTYFDLAMNGTWLERWDTLLRSREAQVNVSPEAAKAISEADVIIYGPGTQHSSLLPSYRIAQIELQEATAPIKAFIVNLEEDHDIIGLSASRLVDSALSAMGDLNNHAKVITHVLYNVPPVYTFTVDWRPVQAGGLCEVPKLYRGATLLVGVYDQACDGNPAVHDGALVVEALKGVGFRPRYGYDIDGVLTEGIVPKQPCVAISGRTFPEYDDFAKHLAAHFPVYIRGSGEYGDHVASGKFKAEMINRLGVTEFHEDRPEQIAIIQRQCPRCTVVSHDVGRPRANGGVVCDTDSGPCACKAWH